MESPLLRDRCVLERNEALNRAQRRKEDQAIQRAAGRKPLSHEEIEECEALLKRINQNGVKSLSRDEAIRFLELEARVKNYGRGRGPFAQHMALPRKVLF